MKLALLSALFCVLALLSGGPKITLNAPSQGGNLVITYERPAGNNDPVTLEVTWSPGDGGPPTQVVIPANETQTSLPVPQNATNVVVADATGGAPSVSQAIMP
ncbi:MAG: hypothetical protein AAF628_20370 [Planctomycetota bacterium]